MKIAIIGGGINGLFTAYFLCRPGVEITLFEQSDLLDGCSHGNAGMIVPSHIIPLAAPGMLATGLKMLLNARSPFYIKPRLSYDLFRWGWLFQRSATEAHVQRSIPPLRDLSLLSKRLYQEFQQSGHFDFGYEERGLFMLYKTAAAEHEEIETAKVANQAGVEARVLTGAEVQAMEPEVQVDVRGAVFYPGDAHLYPNLLIKGLVQYLRQNGVTILDRQEVQDIARQGNKVTAVVTDSGTYSCDELVIATGAWSPMLVKKIGFSLPLQSGKGYSIMMRDVPRNIRIPAIMLEARATATPMGNDLRFGGTMEITDIDLNVNRERVRGIVEAVRNYYPDFRPEVPDDQQIWRGLRPCSPDGLPYIGRIPGFDNLTLATGHGMMGLSLGPATGKLVSEIVMRQPLSMEIGSFSPGRFG